MDYILKGFFRGIFDLILLLTGCIQRSFYLCRVFADRYRPVAVMSLPLGLYCYEEFCRQKADYYEYEYPYGCGPYCGGGLIVIHLITTGTFWYA